MKKGTKNRNRKSYNRMQKIKEVKVPEYYRHGTDRPPYFSSVSRVISLTHRDVSGLVPDTTAFPRSQTNLLENNT